MNSLPGGGGACGWWPPFPLGLAALDKSDKLLVTDKFSRLRRLPCTGVSPVLELLPVEILPLPSPGVFTAMIFQT